MARSYKRDKNGKFASTGGGASSVATSRTRQGAQRQRASYRNVPDAGGQKGLRKGIAGSSQEKTSRTLRRSSLQRAGLGDSSYAGKVSTTRRGNAVSPTKNAASGSSGSSSRGRAQNRAMINRRKKK